MLHLKLFEILHVAVPIVIMFGVSNLLCSLVNSQHLRMYGKADVPPYINTTGRLGVTVVFEKWAVHLQETFIPL
jgi:hypothetical protein